MGRGSVIMSSGLDWERFGVITGGDEVCILPPPTCLKKGWVYPLCPFPFLYCSEILMCKYFFRLALLMFYLFLTI